jgi:hypothetical protein
MTTRGTKLGLAATGGFIFGAVALPNITSNLIYAAFLIVLFAVTQSAILNLVLPEDRR